MNQDYLDDLKKMPLPKQLSDLSVEAAHSLIDLGLTNKRATRNYFVSTPSIRSDYRLLGIATLNDKTINEIIDWAKK